MNERELQLLVQQAAQQQIEVAENLTALETLIQPVIDESPESYELVLRSVDPYPEYSAEAARQLTVGSATGGILIVMASIYYGISITALTVAAPLAVAVSGIAVGIRNYSKHQKGAAYKETLEKITEIFKGAEADENLANAYREKCPNIPQIMKILNYVENGIIQKLCKLFELQYYRLGTRDAKLTTFNKRCLEAIWDPNSQEVIVNAWNGNYNIAIQHEDITNDLIEHENCLRFASLIRKQIVSILVDNQIHRDIRLTGLRDELRDELNEFLAKPANEVHLNFLKLTVFHVIEYAVNNNKICLDKVQKDYQKLVAKIVEDRANENGEHNLCIIM